MRWALVAAFAAQGGPMQLASPAFAHGAEIPRAHTCQGEDTSPELRISGVPDGAKSLALIVDDPDAPDPAAPKRTWVHWVVYDLPPTTTTIPAGGPLPAGAKVGKNDWGKASWGGPCPPIGRHRYFHKLYALDVALPQLEDPTRAELLAAIEGHVLAQVELVGTYQKQ